MSSKVGLLLKGGITTGRFNFVPRRVVGQGGDSALRVW